MLGIAPHPTDPMAVELFQLARQFLTDPKRLRDGFTTPLLVWEGVSSADGEDPLYITVSGVRASKPSKPSTGDSLVFEMKKGNSKGNAFAMGITVGRTEQNDVAIDDASVSRFHAFFQFDPKAQAWKVVDAESKNGTWVNAQKLTGATAQVVMDGARLRFGDIELVYFAPDSFMQYLKNRMER